jgi:integrase
MADGNCEYRLSLDVVARARNEPPPVGTTEAKAWRDRLRGEIRAGTFRDPAAPVITKPDPRLTVGDVMNLYLEQHVRIPERGKAGQVVMTAYINRLRAMPLPAAHGTTITLGEKTLDAVTGADLDALRRDWTLETTAAQGGRTGPNRALKRLRHFFNWAIEKAYTDRSPFKRGHVNTVHFSQEPGRTRRLEGDEEARLLKHATTPLLKALITAGLETGCRIGELLLLRWADVKWDQQALLLPAAITKTREARDVPLTQNLRALLDMRRHAPDGREHAADRFVFGNEVGEPVKYWRVREAWKDTCAAAEITGLHFHDLRRELASTLRESGAPDHIVADVLGHANISTTSRYLKASRAGLTSYVQRFEQHRKQQRVAAKKAANKKAGGIRTPFAHGEAEGAGGEPGTAIKNRAKSLN